MTSEPNQPNYLAPHGDAAVLHTLVDGLFNAHHVASASANTLLLQPSLTTHLLQTLPEDQAVAARHTQQFVAGWGFGVADLVLTRLNGLATFAASICQGGLLECAHTLDSADFQSAEFAAGLEGLRSLLAALADTCCRIDADSETELWQIQSTYNLLRGLAEELHDDCTRLRAAAVAIDNDNLLQELLDRQTDLQTQLGETNAELAKGATTTIGPDVEFGFSFAAEFLEGFSTGAIFGSVLEVVGEADALSEFNQQTAALAGQQTEIGAKIVALVVNIAEDQADKLVLTLVLAQIGVFVAQIQALVELTGSVVDEMKGWTAMLDRLVLASQPPAPAFYTNQVEAGLAFWSEIAAKSPRYQRILTMTSLSMQGESLNPA